jgi:hypothetical protein
MFMPKGTQINKDDIKNIQKLHDTGMFSKTQIAKITKRGWGTVHDIIKSGFNYSKYKQILKGKRTNGEETKEPLFTDAENLVVNCVEDGKTYGLTELPDVPGETSDLDKVFPTDTNLKVTYLTKIQRGVALIVEGVVDQILEEANDER